MLPLPVGNSAEPRLLLKALAKPGWHDGILLEFELDTTTVGSFCD